MRSVLRQSWAMRSGSESMICSAANHGRRVGRTHAGAENQRPRMMLQIINRRGVRRDEPAQARQRFAERAHDELHLVGQAEMAGGAGAISPSTPIACASSTITAAPYCSARRQTSGS
jgi:transcription elongation GreA/GreB family factor